MDFVHISNLKKSEPVDFHVGFKEASPLGTLLKYIAYIPICQGDRGYLRGLPSGKLEVCMHLVQEVLDEKSSLMYNNLYGAGPCKIPDESPLGKQAKQTARFFFISCD